MERVQSQPSDGQLSSKSVFVTGKLKTLQLQIKNRILASSCPCYEAGSTALAGGQQHTMPWLVLGNSHLSEFGCTVLLWCSMGVYWFQVCSLRHLEPQLFFSVLLRSIKLRVFTVLLLLTKEKLRVFFRLRFLTGKYKKRNRNEGLDFISMCSMAKANVK